MEIVKNLNTLKALQKKYKIEFDKDYKYITKTKNLEEKNLYINNKEYIIKYVSGCFYPYLTKTNRICSYNKEKMGENRTRYTLNDTNKSGEKIDFKWVLEDTPENRDIILTEICKRAEIIWK